MADAAGDPTTDPFKAASLIPAGSYKVICNVHGKRAFCFAHNLIVLVLVGSILYCTRM